MRRQKIMSFFETKFKDYFYSIFRIGIGALFLMYGAMKLFGLWGMPGGPAAIGTFVWYAGAGELLIGLGLIFGVFARLAALFGIIEMAIAYVIGHALPNGAWNPIINQGAPALMFMLAFIAILAFGSGKASLELTVFKKELF